MELARDLVARARSGDREAQAAFVAIYQDRVYAVCLALAGSDGEDCAQDTLVAALAGLRRFDPDAPGRLGTFVLQIARNRCVDRARSARVRTWSDVEVDELGGSGDVAADRLSRARDAEVVRRAVLELADDQRAVIALRTWGELEYDEIAAILGVPIGTVRSRLARAREALRARLGDLVSTEGATG
jgi:RNA polymerase sigma-70 factor (ECF subfamily)